MNEQQFNASLKAAFVAPEMPVHMDHKIDAGIARIQNCKMVRRRLTLSFGATAIIAAGVFVLPAVEAQASLGGMMSALDKTTSARVTTFAIDERGNRTQVGTTLIANGNVESLDAKNNVQQVEFENDTFVYDSMSKLYVRYPRKNNGGIKLSQLVGPASSFSVKKRVKIETVKEGGKEFLRATIVNGDLPERYIFDADPKTQLPFHMQVEALESNKWRVRQDIEFDYRKGLTVSKPDFSKTPLVTKEEREAKFYDFMTKNELARVKAPNKTIVIRAIDVAEDGTVFVAYQSGANDPKVNSWSGYQLNISDSLGTSYIRAGDIFTSVNERSAIPKDGKIELEVFLPKNPLPLLAKRIFHVYVAKDSQGNLEQILPGDDVAGGTSKVKVTFPDGHSELKDLPRQEGRGVFEEVYHQDFSRSSCVERPDWAREIASDFYHETHTEIFKARFRAKNAMDFKDWTNAEKYLNEERFWKRESEVRGLSPWELDSTLKNLEIVRKHLQPN